MIGITLEQVLEAAIEARVASMWSALPGRVLSWSPSGTCSVQPFPAAVLNGETMPLPSLDGVPIAYPAGAGGSITYPLKAGDCVLLIFSSSPLARFRSDGAEGDQGESRRFDLSDAWCIPMAGGSSPTSATDRVTVAQPSAQNSKVQIGATPAVPPLPAVPVPLAPGPVLLPGTMQPTGRAARTGDTVTVTLDAIAVGQLIAAMAIIAGGGVPPDIHAPGVIVSGSDIVEVK